MSTNRFQKQPLAKRISESVNFSVLFFVVVMCLFLAGISFLSSSDARDDKQILSDALQRDIVHCYAVEGFYPPTLSYIEQHYGLTYNHSDYLVDYEYVGENVMPNVMIIERGGK